MKRRSKARTAGTGIVLAVPAIVLLSGCYGTKTLRQPITVEEIASDVTEIRSGQEEIREDVRSMEEQLTTQAETIRTLQAENQYLYKELENRLSAIDAKTGNGNQDFHFIKKHDFTGHKGELRYKVKGGDAYVQGDVNGDGKADLMIVVEHVSKLKASDFDL